MGASQALARLSLSTGLLFLLSLHHFHRAGILIALKLNPSFDLAISLLSVHFWKNSSIGAQGKVQARSMKLHLYLREVGNNLNTDEQKSR